MAPGDVADELVDCAVGICRATEDGDADAASAGWEEAARLALGADAALARVVRAFMDETRLTPCPEPLAFRLWEEVESARRGALLTPDAVASMVAATGCSRWQAQRHLRLYPVLDADEQDA